MIKRRVAPLAVIIGMFASSIACGGVISLDVNGVNTFEVLFSVPAQPANHNALSLFSSSTSLNNFSGIATLFDGNTVLAQSARSSVNARYATAGSGFSGAPFFDPIIDYTSIADGSIDGRWVLSVTSGRARFDTDDFIIQPFGDGGTSPGFTGTATSFRAFESSAVPEPSALFILGVTSACFVAFRPRSRSCTA